MFRKTIFLIFIMAMPLSLFATGPSFIKMLINPVGINNEGDILCKTFYQKNDMGAHRLMPTEFNLLIIHADKTWEEVELVSFNSDAYEDEDVMWEHYDFWKNFFVEDFDPDTHSVALLRLINQYSFIPLNKQEILVDREMTLNNFIDEYNLRIVGTKQKTLKGHTSVSNSETVHIMYETGNVLFLQNTIDFREYKLTGAEFDVQTPFLDRSSNLPIPYDTFEITGIIFK